MEDTALRRTPLNDIHRAAGARMVDFGGWDMPVQYSGIVDEHNTVRHAVGLFDVSHMGEIEIRGPEALKLADYVTTNAVARLSNGQAQYSGLLYDHGGFVDDILVHKVADDSFFLCVNASNQEKDFEHIRSLNRFDCEVEFASPKYAQLAIQGPRAIEVAQRLTATLLASLRYYWFADGTFAGSPARIARTGYTGEDGVEVYVAPDRAAATWNAILEAGRPFGIKPCGLGARNTLRLESKMALYGHEIGASISPFEADLAWIVKLDKGDFVGRDALHRQLEKGITRKLAGFEMRGRGIGRDGYEVRIAGQPAGWVTSGSPAPALNKNIGLCYLPVDRARPGEKIEILIRDQAVEAEIVPTPFTGAAARSEKEMNYPENYRYTKEHEWVHVEGGTATVGITFHAQKELGDIVYVDLPKPGTQVETGKSFGSVESVKAVSDVYAPVSGEVIASNDLLATSPEKLNEDPHNAAWLIKVKVASAAEVANLLSAADYQTYVGAES